jgi:hypothetical protein
MIYRDNCFSPADWNKLKLELEVEYSEIRLDVFDLCAVDTLTLDYETYSLWVHTWKSVYSALSDMIRELKEEQEFHYVNKYAKLVNTLLNARAFAKQEHRKRVKPLIEDDQS